MSESSSPSLRQRFARATRLAAIKLSKEQGKPITLLGLARVQSIPPSLESDGPSEIIPRLYLGDYWDACNEKRLRSLGVTHILSVVETRPALAFADEYRTSLKTMHLPIHDSFMTNIVKHLDGTTEFIQKALKSPNSVILASTPLLTTLILMYNTHYNGVFDTLGSLLTRRKPQSYSRCWVSSGHVRRL